MSSRSAPYDELKRKIRNLKKLEMKIRFGPAGKPAEADLVWDAFFDLHELNAGRAKYSIHTLSAMSRDEYRSIVAEFFSHVYYRLYNENGIVNQSIYDPDLLSRLGLPFGADYAAEKKKFHELAMKYHPDTGGDAAKFIELMENYKKLMDKGT
jgi:hypothetical protein